MSNRKSPLYTVIAVLFGIVAIAGGAAKMYRGIGSLSNAGQDPKVDELLKKSDASVAEANSQIMVVVPAFQGLLNDFDTLGLAAFRLEKRDACEKIVEQFSVANNHLQEASISIIEATKLGTDDKTTAFLIDKSRSYELLVKVNAQNIDIVRATLDESIVDMDAVVEKVMSIATSRDADQKAADEATAAANAILKQS